MYAGIPYLIGGLDASGAPTDTVYKGVVEEGVLTGWELADGENRTDGADAATAAQRCRRRRRAPAASCCSAVATSTASPPTACTWPGSKPAHDGRLLAWEPLEGLALPEPRADVVAATVGDFIYVVGGEGPDGATDTVFRLELDDREPATNEAAGLLGWAVAPD